MTHRERYLETLLYGKPDKIPFSPGGPRESTLKAWRTQGLGADANWNEELVKILGIENPNANQMVWHGAQFQMIPEFEQKILERKPGSLVVQDWKGNICEISDQYDPTYCGGKDGKFDFCTRRWIKCPVENQADWEEMKTRYNPDDPARFPSDFDERAAKLRERDYFVSISFSGPFWQLREWMGFENLCMAFADEPDFIRAQLKFWEEHCCAMMDKIFAKFKPDAIHISEDMAYKAKAMISMDMTREFLMPVWKRWADQIRSAGVPLFMVDSDGYVGELIPLWIESGFHANDPQEVAANNDLPAYSRAFGRKMAYMGGVDKRAIAKGGETIRAEMRRLRPAIAGGGYIPGCDHGVPHDISWPNFIDYSRLLAQATGWL